MACGPDIARLCRGILLEAPVRPMFDDSSWRVLANVPRSLQQTTSCAGFDDIARMVHFTTQESFHICADRARR